MMIISQLTFGKWTIGETPPPFFVYMFNRLFLPSHLPCLAFFHYSSAAGQQPPVPNSQQIPELEKQVPVK